MRLLVRSICAVLIGGSVLPGTYPRTWADEPALTVGLFPPGQSYKSLPEWASGRRSRLPEDPAGWAAFRQEEIHKVRVIGKSVKGRPLENSSQRHTSTQRPDDPTDPIGEQDRKSTTIRESSTGIAVTIDPSGTYSIAISKPAWVFAGQLGHRVDNTRVADGKDRLGDFQEVCFDYEATPARTSCIRLYAGRSIILFNTQYPEGGDNVDPFPRFDIYPNNPYRLTHAGAWGERLFDWQPSDGPWLAFDEEGNTFALSAASNFMTAWTSLQGGAITTGIHPDIAQLPSGFEHQTILAIGQGVNATYDLWGHALTDLQGKKRPPNDADVTLQKLGYWTDAGSAYYYARQLGERLPDVLVDIRDYLARNGIRPGYFQLDSWYYPKGNPPAWDKVGDGAWDYRADPALFPKGLGDFQRRLGLPLVAHGRWFDPESPLRSQYQFSGNVSTDLQFWRDYFAYLKENGVTTFEQDWLSFPDRAAAAFDLTDPEAFMSHMAQAAEEAGITLQYCGPLPRHFLEGSKYNALTSIRVNFDRFDRSKWDSFLFNSRLASALGIWPFADVTYSRETKNLLLATLSAGPVGIGGRLGESSIENLKRVVRADGVLVKPDAAIVPMDSVYIAEAKGERPPMMATTYTDHNGHKTGYLFAYRRGGDGLISLRPEALGIAGPAYVYNPLTNSGRVVPQGSTFLDTVDTDGSFYIVAPVGRSGIAFLGDEGKYVSTGKQRVAALADDGALKATITFAEGETTVTVHGYALSKPRIDAAAGSASLLSYDPQTHLFRIELTPGADRTAALTLRP
jgi:hypothetical protein